MTSGILLFATLAPLLWAISNHADKYLVSKYFRGKGVGGLMIISSFFSVILLPIIFCFDQTVLNVTLQSALILMLAGLANAFAIWFYLKALNEGESSVVVPFMQLIPIFVFLLGYLFLGEVLTAKQILGGTVIIIGAAILSLDMVAGEPIKIKTKVVLFMTWCSLLFALYTVLFKVVSIEDGFWVGAFWEAVGLILSGFIFFSIKPYRDEFFQIFLSNSKPIISLNLANETITIAGNWVITFASLFAPVALVSLIAGYQPLFVFIIGILLTLFIPKIAKEDLSKKAVLQKSVAIAIVILGTYFLV